MALLPRPMIPPAPLPFLPLGTQIADRMVRMIGLGELPSGARLKEKDLADRMEASRIPVREALRLLLGQGLLTRQGTTHRGLRVIDLDQRWSDELRLVQTDLLTRAADLAATRLQQRPTAAESLDQALQEIAAATRAGDIDAWVQADLHFHATITELSGSPMLQALCDALSRHRAVFLTRQLVQNGMPTGPEDPPRQLPLALALRAGPGPALAECVRRHVQSWPSLFAARRV